MNQIANQIASQLAGQLASPTGLDSSAGGAVAWITAGIGWEPEIRGLLTVALAAAVLIGSVWLLLMTNTGVRLGSMVVLAGFFGWFTIMAGSWWIFGIGYVGSNPSWEFVDTYYDEAGIESDGIETAHRANVNMLPDPNCTAERIFPVAETGWTFTPPQQGCVPRAIGLVLAYPGADRQAVIDEFASVGEAGIAEAARAGNELRQPEDPRKLDEAELLQEIQDQIDRREIVIDQLSLSSLAAGAPQVLEWASTEGYIALNGGWRLLSSNEAGEATAAAEAVLIAQNLFPANAEAATPAYAIEDTYQRGGKPDPQSDGVWDRVVNKITNSARITHPPNYTVVQARSVVPRPQESGAPPPVAEIDTSAATVSIVLQRNLGDLRLVPALVTIGSGLIFVALCLNLHARDLRLRRSQQEFENPASENPVSDNPASRVQQ